MTVAAGSGVINHYAGGSPINRTAAVIAPGALVMALIYAWGPLSGLHINPAVTFAFAARRVFPRTWILPCWMAQFAGAIAAAVFRQGYSYGTSREGFQPGTVRQLIVVTGPGRDLPAIREGCHVKDR